VRDVILSQLSFDNLIKNHHPDDLANDLRKAIFNEEEVVHEENSFQRLSANVQK